MTIVRIGNPITTPSGHLWWPFSPHPSDVHSADFRALARIPRWHGYTTTPMSVAEHCVRVARLLAKWGCSSYIQLQGLVHDIHEIYPPGDVPGPVLRSDCIGGAALREMERASRDAVRVALGLPVEFADIVHDADLVLLETERRDLMPLAPEGLFKHRAEPLPERICPWSWELAWERWQAEFVDLGGRVLAEAA